MATLGELVVNLIAKTAPFESGMKRSSKTVTDLERVTQQATKTFNSFFSRLASGALGALSVVGLIRGIRGEMLALDSMMKMSRRTGIGFEDLQILAHGAELSGIAFTQLGSALQQYIGKLGKAQYKTSEATLALKSMNLTAGDLARMPLVDQLGLLADRLNAIQSPEIRVGIAQDLFGESGTAMLNLFENGSEGIAKFADQVKLAGLVSKDTGQEMEKANDRITIAKRAWGLLMAELAVLSTPAMQRATQSLQVSTRGAHNAGLGVRGLWTWATGGKTAGLQSEFNKMLGLDKVQVSRVTTLAERQRTFGNRMASQSLLGLGGQAGQQAIGFGQGLQSMATGIAGSVSSQVKNLVQQQQSQWQASLFRGRLASGVGSVAEVARRLVADTDVAEAWSSVGAGDGGQAKLGGSRAAVEENAKRLREKQLQVEIDQLERLKEMAKAMLDPARIQQFIVTSLGG